MNTNWSGRRAVGVALGVTIFTFAAGMLGLLDLWGGLHLFGGGSDFWAMTEAVATAVAAATVVGASVFAYLELAEQSKSRYMTVADRLFDELNEPANVQARRWIYQNLPADPALGLAQMGEADRDKVKQVLNSMDRVAFLTQAGWIPDEMIMPWMSIMVVKAWAKLGPYIDYESQRRSEPDYYRQVRRLAERCVLWRQEHEPKNPITWVEHAL